MSEIDILCAEVFFKEQERLFPTPVVETVDGALAFLEDAMAIVFDSESELVEYLNEEGFDVDGEDVSEMLEVFVLPDERLLYVEA